MSVIALLMARHFSPLHFMGIEGCGILNLVHFHHFWADKRGGIKEWPAKPLQSLLTLKVVMSQAWFNERYHSQSGTAF